MKWKLFIVMALAVTLLEGTEAQEARRRETVDISAVGVDGSTKTMSVRPDTTRLFLSDIPHELARVDGLANLPALEYLSMQSVDFTRTDFSFLFNISETLKTLQMSFASLPETLEFLEFVPNLIAFASDETHRLPDSLVVDLNANRSIRYFAINGGSTEGRITISNVPCSLEVVSFLGTNFEGTSIELLSSLVGHGVEIWLLESQLDGLDQVPPNVVVPTPDMYRGALEEYDL